MTLRAPFPWFGGKSRVAHLVWDAFGADVANYVEPFAGSLAVLLGRPGEPRVETVNDLDCYLANFWRALRADPEAVAAHADWPVNEADLHARHRWLVAQRDFRERMRREPDFHDAKVAGWWVWGISQWIGSGWCAQPAWEEQAEAGAKKGVGIRTAEHAKRPTLDKPGRGVHQLSVRGRDESQAERLRKLRMHGGRPALTVSNGVHARAVRGTVSSIWQQKPDLSGSRGATGRGVLASGARGSVLEWMHALAERLRHVRVCCGDWARVLGPSATVAIGTTAVLLDPPYSAEAGRDPSLYAHEDLEVAHAVREWALAHGDNPRFRIALCGYDGEHQMPASWRCMAWRAPGGYAASAGNIANAQRERVWFSPYCLGERQPSLALWGRP